MAAAENVTNRESRWITIGIPCIIALLAALLLAGIGYGSYRIVKSFRRGQGLVTEREDYAESTITNNDDYID